MILIVWSLFYCGLIIGELIAMLIKYKTYNLAVDRYDWYCAIILSCFICFVFLFLFVLIIFQINFIGQNITTREYIKNKFIAGNPFNQGFSANFGSFFRDIDDYKNLIDYNDSARSYKCNLVFAHEGEKVGKKSEKSDNLMNNSTDSAIALTDIAV